MAKKKEPEPEADEDPFEFGEDVCKICGAHIGWGIKALHLENCGEHEQETIQ
jgi:hypothetical protein